MRRRAVVAGLLVLGWSGLALASGCGRYGPPRRAVSAPPPTRAPAEAQPAPPAGAGEKETLGEPDELQGETSP